MIINPYSEEMVLEVIEEIGCTYYACQASAFMKSSQRPGQFLIRLLYTNMADMPFSHLNL